MCFPIPISKFNATRSVACEDSYSDGVIFSMLKQTMNPSWCSVFLLPLGGAKVGGLLLHMEKYNRQVQHNLTFFLEDFFRRLCATTTGTQCFQSGLWTSKCNNSGVQLFMIF